MNLNHFNGHLHYPNDIDRSLNETVVDKIRKYRDEYNRNPPSSVSFIPIVTSTSGRLHSEFVLLLFLQTHRETDLFFSPSGVHPKSSTLRITLNIDGVPARVTKCIRVV